jgi:SAM-dependent methyltransferase
MSVRRSIQRIPIAGPVARRALIRGQELWWQDVRAPLRLLYVRALNALRGFRNAHASTAPNVARRNSRRAYEKIFGDDDLLAEYLTADRLRFYDEVVEVCVRLAPKRVVDVGCGGGHLLQRLCERVPLDEVVGVDRAASAIARARKALPGARFLIQDLYETGSLDGYDLVVCTEVLEHVRRPTDAVRALVRICVESGVVLLTVPDGEQDDWEGHLNFWSERDLRAFLEQFGDVNIERIDAGASLLALLTPALNTGQRRACT